MAVSQAPLEVVPLGGLGEFGMNMMARHLGRDDHRRRCRRRCSRTRTARRRSDHAGSDLSAESAASSALVLTHGHEDHIGGVPYVVAARRRAGLRHAAHAGARRAEAGRTRHRAPAIACTPVRPARSRARSARSRSSSSASRTAFPTASRSPSTRRSARSSTPATSRSIRRRSTASTSTSTASRRSASEGVLALFADSTNIDRPGFTGSELEVVERVRGDLHVRDGPAGRRDVLVEHLSDADARRLAEQFEPQGRVRRPRHDRRTPRSRMRLGYLRCRPGVQIRDCDVAALPGAGRALHRDRIAGRAAIGAVAHRHRRSPPREARPRRHGGAVGAGDSRQREGDRPRHQPPRPAAAPTSSRGTKHVHVSGHGSEEELKLVLSLVRPRYFVPVHGEYRQLAQHARVAERVTRGSRRADDVLLTENGDSCSFDADGAPHRRQGADGPRADRRHARRRGRRRSAARPAAPRRRRPRLPVVAISKQTGALDGVARDRHARRRRRWTTSEALLGDARSACSPSASASSSVEERTDPGLLRRSMRVEAPALLPQADGTAAARAARRHGDLIARGHRHRPCRDAPASLSASRCSRRR